MTRKIDQRTRLTTPAGVPIGKVDILLPIVVFACNRPRALKNHVNALLKYVIG